MTVVILYNYGTMERPDREVARAFDAIVARRAAKPLPNRGLLVPIPGCRCHSKDPVLTMQHSVYRIRECKGCHGGR